MCSKPHIVHNQDTRCVRLPQKNVDRYLRIRAFRRAGGPRGLVAGRVARRVGAAGTGVFAPGKRRFFVIGVSVFFRRFFFGRRSRLHLLQLPSGASGRDHEIALLVLMYVVKDSSF